MSLDPNVLIGVASLAGVFVGFGALISIVRSGDIEPPQLGLIWLLVSISLVAIVASLVPLVLASYGMDEATVWAISSAVYLALRWVVIALAVTSRAYHRTLAGQAATAGPWPLGSGCFGWSSGPPSRSRCS